MPYILLNAVCITVCVIVSEIGFLEDILRFDELSQVLDCCSFLVCAISTTEFRCLCPDALNSGGEDFIYLAFR